MSVIRDTELLKITDTDLLLDDDAHDVRGRKVIDRDGVTIGHVSNLFVDVEKRRIRLLEIRTAGLPGFGRHALLPVDAVTSIRTHEIHIDQTRDRVAHSPLYSPQLIPMPTREYWEPFYGYYGLSQPVVEARGMFTDS